MKRLGLVALALSLSSCDDVTIDCSGRTYTDCGAGCAWYQEGPAEEGVGQCFKLCGSDEDCADDEACINKYFPSDEEQVIVTADVCLSETEGTN